MIHIYCAKTLLTAVQVICMVGLNIGLNIPFILLKTGKSKVRLHGISLQKMFHVDLNQWLKSQM